jgi:hypothetical protein
VDTGELAVTFSIPAKNIRKGGSQAIVKPVDTPIKPCGDKYGIQEIYVAVVCSPAAHRVLSF